jgi:DNA ligase-associated metallophosphoesterase
MLLTIDAHELLLCKEKILFWPAQHAILLADLHLTKDTHFRKHGIGVPAGATERTLARLAFVISKYRPETVFLLGDVFHSDRNAGIEVMHPWRKRFPAVRFMLIPGNHDVLDSSLYEVMGLELCVKELQVGNVLLSHEPLSESQQLNICGHLHPSIVLHGKAKQQLKLPCFYYRKRSLVLPAFGDFTGTQPVKPSKSDSIFAIAGDEVIAIDYINLK